MGSSSGIFFFGIYLRHSFQIRSVDIDAEDAMLRSLWGRTLGMDTVQPNPSPSARKSLSRSMQVSSVTPGKA
jgi:hypothetical protein